MLDVTLDQKPKYSCATLEHVEHTCNDFLVSLYRVPRIDAYGQEVLPTALW